MRSSRTEAVLRSVERGRTSTNQKFLRVAYRTDGHRKTAYILFRRVRQNGDILHPGT